MREEKTNTRSSYSFSQYLFKQRLILFSILGFVTGVFLSSIMFVSPLVALLFIVVASGIVASEKVWNGKIFSHAWMIFVVLIAASVGILRYNIKDFHPLNTELESKVGEEVEIVGIVSTEPEAKENSMRFVVRSGMENFLVSADLYADVSYGDEVSVVGELEKPGVIDDGTGRAFDYAEYLSKDDIYYTVSFSEVEKLSSGHGSTLKTPLFKLKSRFVKNIKTILSEPESSLLAGLVVSGKEAMPKDVLEDFKRSGVVHIVVLSGYNIAIIAEFLRKMFESIFLWTRSKTALSFGGPRLASGFSIAGIILFVLMTGAPATVVRAAIMVLVVVSAKLFGRDYSASRALVFAAFLMILENPKILVFDPSFQLSFLATTALIYVVPTVEKFLKWVPEKWEFRTVLATTLATQTVVMPYLLYSMGEVSLVALPANMLILLIIPITMLVGFLATLISFVSTTLALPLSFIAHLLLSWVLGVSHTLGNLTFAQISIPTFPLWATVMLYLMLVVLLRPLRVEKLWPDSRTSPHNVRSSL